MAATAIPKHLIAVCSECDKDIKLGDRMVCRDCETAGEEEAFENGAQEASEENDSAAQEIRDWAARRQLLGQISKEVRAELELCADDIEVGHG